MLYLGYRELTSRNKARYLHFKSKCKPKEAAKPLECLKNVDPCLFPLCKQVLIQQIKRSWFIAKLCKNAAVADPLANNTLLDYGLNCLTIMYMLNGLTMNKYLKA